ncbi:hypothetical protein [Frigoriglobus tundricola]|uniref:hypothetical protein n=1 Tax=Frigoriglobus tundricola TaxID=2774151 RepID=UPI00148ED7C5|nr:hypothetical protein [Frigoriglobus tundricola]
MAVPAPAGRDCQIVFDVGAGPSAPIPLALLPDGSVIPLNAPVRDGTAECCRPVDPAPVVAPPPRPPASPVTLWHRLLFGAVVLAVNGLVMGWAWRRGQRDRTRKKHNG